MKRLTEIQAREVLHHKLINFEQVAEEFYKDAPGSRPGSRLRRRLEAKKLTTGTLDRLTIVFTDLYHRLVDEQII